MRRELNWSAVGWRESTKRPAVKFKNPQATFTRGGESPTPRGFANGAGDSDKRRKQFREEMRRGLAGILRKAIPGLTQTKCKSMAIVVLYILKAVAATAQDSGARRALLSEMRELVRTYLASAA
jgi:hypothetical protein